MPEPITIASAVGAIVASGIKLCLTVYGTIDGMKQAPKHLEAMSSDLKDFYSILGTIQFYLDEKELTQALLHSQSCDNLQSVLANCVSVLQDFDKIVSGYIKAGRELSLTKWQKVSWTWKLADVESLRKHLSDHKATLSVAIGMANLASNGMARRASASQMAEAKAQIAALVARLSHLDEKDHDSNIIMENQRATIRAFTNDAESILTSAATLPTRNPSLQVSTLAVESTTSASFVTAWTSAGSREASSNNPVFPRQLMVRGIGNRTIVLQSSTFRHGHHLMVAVEEKTDVPTPYFWLTYAGKVIGEMTDMSTVPHDATVIARYRAVGREEKHSNEECTSDHDSCPRHQAITRRRQLETIDEKLSSLLSSDTPRPNYDSSPESLSDTSSDDTWGAACKRRKECEIVMAHAARKNAMISLPLWKHIGRRILMPTWRRPSRWSM